MTTKLSTQDCINEIKRKYPKYSNGWKRTNKFKSYFNDDCGVVRLFESKKYPNHIVFSFEFENDLKTVRLLEKIDMTTENLLLSVREWERGDITESESVHSILNNHFIYLNVVSQSVTKYDGSYEALDFENCEVSEITNNSCTVFHGGDWQNGARGCYVYCKDVVRGEYGFYITKINKN